MSAQRLSNRTRDLLAAMAVFVLCLSQQIQAKADEVLQNAQNGHKFAESELGEQYYEKKDYTRAREWFLKAAEQGEAMAQGMLGAMSYLSEGGPKDLIQARKWYLASANGLLMPEAKRAVSAALCGMYYRGEGGPKDLAGAAKWCLAAAQLGDVNSQAVVGKMYQDGEGVTKDYTEARRWYLDAAKQGHVLAEGMLGGMYIYGEGGPKDYSEARRWFLKAAEQHEPNAEVMLGAMYYYGWGGPRNYAEARKWFLKSARQGNADARMMLRQGNGVVVTSRPGYNQAPTFSAPSWFTCHSVLSGAPMIAGMAGCSPW